MWMCDTQLELTEHCACAALLHIPESVARKLLSWIEHNQVVGIEQPANVVHPDRHHPLGSYDAQKGRAATADQQSFTGMVSAKIFKVPRQTGKKLVAGSFSSVD